jgi:hypothetical protein
MDFGTDLNAMAERMIPFVAVVFIVGAVVLILAQWREGRSAERRTRFLRRYDQKR